MKDYYSILKLNRYASDDEIKKSYRTLAMEWHPDRNKSNDAHDSFTLINEAYEILSDPGRRLEYDSIFFNEKIVTAEFSNWQNQAKDNAKRYADMDFEKFKTKILDEILLVAKHSTGFGCLGIIIIGMLLGIGLIIKSAIDGDNEMAQLGFITLIGYGLFSLWVYPRVTGRYQQEREKMNRNQNKETNEKHQPHGILFKTETIQFILNSTVLEENLKDLKKEFLWMFEQKTVEDLTEEKYLAKALLYKLYNRKRIKKSGIDPLFGKEYKTRCYAIKNLKFTLGGPPSYLNNENSPFWFKESSGLFDEKYLIGFICKADAEDFLMKKTNNTTQYEIVFVIVHQSGLYWSYDEIPNGKNWDVTVADRICWPEEF